MPRSPDPAGHREITVRCTPATRSLDVCGDWYDVIGHGLEAAIMSTLRSALSAVVRAIHEPGGAMDVLGGYARTVEGTPATTAVKAVTDALLTRPGVAGGGRDDIVLTIVRP